MWDTITITPNTKSSWANSYLSWLCAIRDVKSDERCPFR